MKALLFGILAGSLTLAAYLFVTMLYCFAGPASTPYMESMACVSTGHPLIALFLVAITVAIASLAALIQD